MILYFSATGNSKYIAEQIALAIGTEAISIQNVTDQTLNNITGIVSPTYAWGIPTIVEQFLQTHAINKGDNSLFYIATYGTTSGQSSYWAEKSLKAKSCITFDAFYGVKMPDTWTPIFDLSDRGKVDKINRDVEQQLNYIIKLIKKNSKGNYIRNKLPAIARVVYYPYYNIMRKTKHFTLEDNCIGCGLCAKKCPDKAIVMKNNKPVWVKDKCIMCLGCLHRCPKFAIQYGKHTKNHGQYINPNTKV